MSCKAVGPVIYVSRRAARGRRMCQAPAALHVKSDFDSSL